MAGDSYLLTLAIISLVRRESLPPHARTSHRALGFSTSSIQRCSLYTENIFCFTSLIYFYI